MIGRIALGAFVSPWLWGGVINRGRGGNEHRNNTIVLRYFWSLWLNARPEAGTGAGRHEAG